MKNKYLLKAWGIAIALFLQLSVNAQDWAEIMEDNSANFYQAQQSFNDYWKNRPIEKGKGWRAYKRWEWFMEPRVYPTGNRDKMLQAYAEYYQHNNINKQQKTASSSGSWTLTGPSTVPSNGGGAGRINFITFHPTDANTFYVGTPAGGLWYTHDGGSSWNTSTDDLEIIGTSDLVINSYNPNIMYLATGDGDGGTTYSIGILKSIDGGSTWTTTGLGWSVSSGYKISKLLIHPTDTSILLAATNGGIYRSSNGGRAWTKVQSGSFKDMKFCPNDPSIVYASGDMFYRSSNTGSSFTQVTSGLPLYYSVNRMAIATTAANSDYVYVLVAWGSSGSYGFYGIYRSTDKGQTFSTKATSPNLLGWEADGSDFGGQGWYDLAVATSPSNANEVYTGGVNIWKTLDGGTNWDISAHWYGQSGNPYVHADVHALQFHPASTTDLYACTDGGLFKTTDGGVTWTDLSDGLAIRQSYRIGISSSSKDLFLTGNQDNGTDLYKSGNFKRVLGGDGMECIIDHADENYMYGEYYYGSISRSTNGGSSFSDITSSITETGAWVTPFVMDPSDSKILYAGFNNVWKTTNRGDSWTSISSFGSSSSTLNALAVAASNTQYIYAATYSKIYKTSNGGSSWTDITTGLPTSTASLTYIAIDPTDANHVYVTFSGYVAGAKVYETTDGGTNWTNISGTLPNLPVNCIAYEKGSNDALYIGTDAGVYYMDNLLTDWEAFSNGLPNTIVNELEIHLQSGTIKAATYGRGIWESPLYASQTLAPTADFSSSTTEVCPGASVQFSDNSGYSPTSWEWTFSGGVPSTSTDKNPIVTYPTEGWYDVTLKASNGNGTHSTTKSSFITVGAQVIPFEENLNGTTFPPSGWQIENNDASVTWAQTAVVSADGTTSNCAFVNFFNYSTAGATDGLISSAIDLSDYNDSIYLSFNVAYRTYSSGYSDGLTIYVSTDCGTTYNSVPVYDKSGASLQTLSSSSTEFYPLYKSDWRAESVDLSPYAGQFIVLKFESTCDYGNNLFIDNIDVSTTGAIVTSNHKDQMGQRFYIYPNPAQGVLFIELSSQKDETIAYELTDLNGRMVYNGNAAVESGLFKTSLELAKFSAGVYFFKMKTSNETYNRKIVIE